MCKFFEFLIDFFDFSCFKEYIFEKFNVIAIFTEIVFEERGHKEIYRELSAGLDEP